MFISSNTCLFIYIYRERERDTSYSTICIHRIYCMDSGAPGGHELLHEAHVFQTHLLLNMIPLKKSPQHMDGMCFTVFFFIISSFTPRATSDKHNWRLRSKRRP